MHIKKSTDSQLFIDIPIIVDNIYVQLTVQLRTVRTGTVHVFEFLHNCVDQY